LNEVLDYAVAAASTGPCANHQHLTLGLITMPPPQYLFTGLMLNALPDTQQTCQSTEDKSIEEDDSHALTNEHYDKLAAVSQSH